MASTIAFYTGDGATTDFTVPFDYLAKKFVRVSLGVTILKGGDYGDTSKDYYFLDKTKVRLKVPPQEGEVLTIRRYTSATDRVVSFKDASVLKATDLDASSVQTIHIAEESRDIINDALIKDKEGNWDAKGNRIVNVGTPEADSDAVPYGVYKADALGAYQAKLGAEGARDRAIEAETNSKKSEANSKLSEENAQASADTAVSASEHADAVKVENQAILQEAKEIRDENKVLDTNTKNNANVAQVKANEAKVSETNAKKSEVNSKESEGNAKTSETNAKASEVEAKRQADLAKDYANQAAGGQMNADWNETVATSKAFIKNKPTLGALASKDSIAYSEITGTPPEQDLSGLATKSELQTGLAGKAPMSHTHTIANVTNLQTALDAKANDADLQVDLTAIRESITNVSSKVDGIGDTLSPTYAKKQAILDACDKALNGANPVNAVDPTFINQLAEKLSKLGTVRPLGFHYLHPYGTVPADSIICNGATYSRALYKDFFDYITTQGWVKTEAEWQEIATRDNGFCPFYSDGDGSTNFRTPKFAPYQQIAMEVAQATTYHQAGLPDLNGDILTWLTLDESKIATGVFKNSVKQSTEWSGHSSNWGTVATTLRFKASDYSPVYGRTDTVQPESHEWVMCVVAYGIATNVGSVDIQNVMSAVNAVQAQVGEIPTPKAYVTKTYVSGTQGYRVWSDGFIEQWGKVNVPGEDRNETLTFQKPFKDTNYNIQTAGYSLSDRHACVMSKTATSVTIRAWNNDNDWYAFGY